MAELVIRRAEAKDVETIETLEQLCFSQPWSYESIYQDIVENDKAVYIVAETEGQVIGYAGLWIIVDEGHITNVAVSPDYRRNSVGNTIITALLQVTEDMGVKRHTLEVRKSNQAAINLYEKQGFIEAGERKGYYEDNGEDALIMWRESEDEE